jgi:hypothetical protein
MATRFFMGFILADPTVIAVDFTCLISVLRDGVFGIGGAAAREFD